MDQGEFYRLIRQCGCGSGLISSWCKDEQGVDLKACESCKPKLLMRIFEDKHLDLFEEWLGTLFSEQAAEGYEWVWADLLKEKGCERVVGLEEAERRRGDRIMIPCPNGNEISGDLGDKSVHILVPREYAEQVLLHGKMIF